MTAETPREHRPRVLKRASIITGPSKSEISCIVRNQHLNGAELKVPADVPVPELFTLYVPIDGVAYDARLRWRRGDRIGIELIGTRPKPRFHYG